MSRALAGLYTDAAEALRFDDRETAARLLAQAADDLANASPLLADETQAIVDTLPRMDADDVRRAAGDCRMVAADLAANARRDLERLKIVAPKRRKGTP